MADIINWITCILGESGAVLQDLPKAWNVRPYVHSHSSIISGCSGSVLCLGDWICPDILCAAFKSGNFFHGLPFYWHNYPRNTTFAMHY